MDDEVRKATEARLGYEFEDESLLSLALTHASNSDSRLDSNERLEFLGDAVLGMITCEMIFRKYPSLLEGEMTKIKSATVSRRACADIAQRLGFHEALILGKGMQGQCELPPSLSAAVLESLIAAVYLDGGMDPVRRFLEPLLEPVIEQAADSGHHENYKSLLQQHSQRELIEPPAYRVLDEKGPDHAKCFKVCVELKGVRHTPAWGASKKEAEQRAALYALSELGVLSTEEIDDDGEVGFDRGSTSPGLRGRE